MIITCFRIVTQFTIHHYNLLIQCHVHVILNCMKRTKENDLTAIKVNRSEKQYFLITIRYFILINIRYGQLGFIRTEIISFYQKQKMRAINHFDVIHVKHSIIENVRKSQRRSMKTQEEIEPLKLCCIQQNNLDQSLKRTILTIEQTSFSSQITPTIKKIYGIQFHGIKLNCKNGSLFFIHCTSLKNSVWLENTKSFFSFLNRTSHSPKVPYEIAMQEFDSA